MTQPPQPWHLEWTRAKGTPKTRAARGLRAGATQYKLQGFICMHVCDQYRSSLKSGQKLRSQPWVLEWGWDERHTGKCHIHFLSPFLWWVLGLLWQWRRQDGLGSLYSPSCSPWTFSGNVNGTEGPQNGGW